MSKALETILILNEAIGDVVTVSALSDGDSWKKGDTFKAERTDKGVMVKTKKPSEYTDPRQFKKLWKVMK